MKRFAIFIACGLFGFSTAVSAMNITIHPHFYSIRPSQSQQPPQPPNPSLFKRFCTAVANRVSPYLPAAGTVRSALNPFIPSSRTVLVGLSGSLLQTGLSLCSTARTVSGLDGDRFNLSNGLIYANDTFLGGQCVIDHNDDDRRAYYSVEPARYDFLTKRSHFPDYIHRCQQCIEDLETLTNNDDGNAHVRQELRDKLGRFIRFINRFDRFFAVAEARMNAEGRNPQETYEELNNLLHDNEYEVFTDECESLHNEVAIQRDLDQNPAIANRLIVLDEFIHDSEQCVNDLEEGQRPPDNPPQIPANRFKSGWSPVYASMAAAKSIGSSFLFAKAVALAGSVGTLQKAGAWLALASAKPGFCGFATLFGLNCATAFGTMATAYALEKLVIKPWLKPLLIRVSCKLRGIPYNPQPHNGQPAH